MADLEKNVDIIFNGRDELSATMKSLNRNVDDFSKNVQAATEPLANLGKKAALLEAALITLAAAGFVNAYNKSVDFESAMIELEKVIGNQPEQLEKAKQAALEMSDQYGVSSIDLVDSIANFKQAGFDLDESIGLVKSSIDLMIAGQMEAADSSEALIKILKGFDAPASEAGRAIDILNEISTKYATDVPKLAEAMADFAPTAQAMGLSMEEAAGLLTPVIESFQSGSEAARSMNTALLRLADPVPKTLKALEDLNVAVVDSNGQQRSAYDILLDVAGAYDGLTDTQKATYASQIAGKDQAAKVLTVFNDLNSVLEITATAYDSAGSAAAEVEARLKSAQVQIDRMKTGWENLNIAIGLKFKESATGAITGLTEIEAALKTAVNEGSFDPIFDAINKFADDIYASLSVIAENLPEALAGVEFDDLIKSFENLGGEIADALESLTGEDIDLSTVDGLTTAIQAVIDSITALTNFTAGFVEGLNPLLTAIGEGAQGFRDMGADGQKLAGDMSGWAQSANTLFSAFDSIKTALWSLTAIQGTSILPGVVTALEGTAAGATAAGVAVVALATGLDTAYDSAMEFLGIDYNGIIDSYDGLTESTNAIFDVLTGKRDWWTGEYKDEVDKVASAEPVEVPAVLAIEEFEAPDIPELDPIPVELQAVTDDQIAGWEETANKVLEPIELEEKEVNIDIAKAEIEKDIESIKATAETAQTAMEWTAKMDIAQVEADAAVLQTTMTELGDTIDSTGSVLSDLFGQLGSGDLDMQGIWMIRDQIREEADMRREAFDLQQKMTQAEMDYMNDRRDAMKNGEGLIKIDCEGVEPELEMVMWKIIEKVQVRAAENADEFLLGATT